MLITFIAVCTIIAIAAFLKYLIDVQKDVVVTESQRDLGIRPIFKRTGKSLRMKYRKHGVFPHEKHGIKYSIAELSGTIDGIAVEAHAGNRDDLNAPGSILIRAEYGIDVDIIGHFRITLERSKNRFLKVGGHADLILGDAIFDDQVMIEAENHCAMLALLDCNVRQRLIELGRRSSYFEFSDSGANAYLREESIKKPDELVACIELAALIGKNLSLSSDVRKMLMVNIDKEPVTVLRVANIDALGKHFTLDEEIRELFIKNLGDENLDVQIASARYLGKDGMRHLVSLLEQADGISEAMILKIISIFGSDEFRESAPVLKNLFVTLESDAAKIGILSALGNIGDGEHAPFVAEQLHGHSHEVTIAAIEALGSCGTVESVERLYGLLDGSLSKHAEKAIAAIQARLGDVEKGWLSTAALAEKEGALSNADGAEEGALSKEEKDK